MGAANLLGDLAVFSNRAFRFENGQDRLEMRIPTMPVGYSDLIPAGIPI